MKAYTEDVALEAGHNASWTYFPPVTMPPVLAIVRTKCHPHIVRRALLNGCEMSLTGRLITMIVMMVVMIRAVTSKKKLKIKCFCHLVAYFHLLSKIDSQK